MAQIYVCGGRDGVGKGGGKPLARVGRLTWYREEGESRPSRSLAEDAVSLYGAVAGFVRLPTCVLDVKGL